jgi:ribosome-binding factor A
MSQRVLRVRELIQRELGGMLQREIDFGGVLVTIHDVDITPDFRHCQVYFGVIGRARDEKWVLEQLEKHRVPLQSKLSKRVILKNTPQLHFKLDHSVERGVQILRAIEDLPPFAEGSEESGGQDAQATAPDNQTP